MDQTSQSGWTVGGQHQCQTNPPCRILVVDQDSDHRLLYADVLARPDYEVDAAEDGAAAWQALNTESYDLLITDNSVPKISGVQLLMKLHAARMAVPVIMAAGILPNEEFARHPWLQPAATLLKPYTLDELLGTVKEVLRATVQVPERITPPPTWKWPSQPLAVGLQL